MPGFFGTYGGGVRGRAGPRWPHLVTAGCVLALAGGWMAGCKKKPEPGAAIDVVVGWGETGLQPGQMNYPRAIDADEGMLWVIDKGAQAQRFEAKTGKRAGGWMLKDYQFGKPTGVTCWRLGQRDLLLVPETHYHRVTVFEVPKDYREGEPPILTRFGSFGRGDGQFTFPTDVAVLPTPKDGGKGIARLYVSEYGGNDRISAFDAVDPADPGKGFVFAFAFGSFGDSADAGNVQFSRPQSVEVDAERRELVVTDACNHRVGRFTLEGKLIAWIGSPESASEAPGHFLYPYGLKLLGDGTALVSEFQSSRVQHIDLLTGRGLGTYGHRGRGPGEITSPWGVTVDGGLAYVLDSGSDRVLAFELPAKQKPRKDELASGLASGGASGGAGSAKGGGPS